MTDLEATEKTNTSSPDAELPLQTNEDGSALCTSQFHMVVDQLKDKEKMLASLGAYSESSEGAGGVRHRKRTKPAEPSEEEFVFLDVTADNEIEAHKMEQNYMFGFKKWKSHVTKRPLDERSEIVKTLYEQPKKVKPFIHSTLSVGNVLYALLIGWWLALVYLLVALLMLITIIGRHHAKFCWALSQYFLWPFGKFVKERTCYELEEISEPVDEKEPLLSNGISASHDSASSLTGSNSLPAYVKKESNECWRRPSTYVWLILGCPILLLAHAIVIMATGLMVVFIPISKLNIIAVRKVLLLPPEKLRINKTSDFKSDDCTYSLEVVMCSYQAVNVYYYKYTVDGMNIILFNMLLFVVCTIILGYADTSNVVAHPIVKFVMGLVAIIPLAYYIGMGITSISAQSTNAVGAVLNATFGSIVELILYVSMLVKMKDPRTASTCYNTLVKSALVGTLLVTMLFIPGISMVVGGIKHSVQRFNMKTASVSSTLLFISIAGMFSPTIFNKVYGIFSCQNCTSTIYNMTVQDGFQCNECSQTFDPDSSFYADKVRPIVYICAALQLLAYIVGLIFTLKTHSHVLEEQLQLPAGSQEHTMMHWGRIKSTVILLCAVIMMSLCAEVVVQNIEPVLSISSVPDMFFGVTLLAIVPDIPEMVNGVQFALKNNINLSIDIGSSVAVQVTLLQVPILILADAIYPLHFYMIFSDVHMWSVIISAIIMNYIFIDGKSNYFQGAMLCIVYFMLLSMYFFAIDSDYNGCIPG
ncbi:low affinity vacuolar monovalent cation/H(+) antiporter-like isoform X2 [Acanthaster planci]|uniref:Low affinity vacuolar monovalent cation/H(+) antiporter-like isoform X2 n=1 Tax=Acanthaster planci TaxID=133434 RepID=A0A8B7Y568_ACAPL|nr:low affinity vacuolar monovalent cation/H(+) antiporter-like isoform X2 [Acanthaster planci]